MTAFMIFHSTINNEDKFKSYASEVPATLKPYKGEIVLKGKMSEVFVGELPYENIGIIQFPDLRSAHEWYRSAPYQQLVTTRNEAADMLVTSYEVPQQSPRS